MWWIIGGVLLLVLFIVAYLFIRGANVKQKKGYLRSLENEEQIKAVRDLQE